MEDVEEERDCPNDDDADDAEDADEHDVVGSYPESDVIEPSLEQAELFRLIVSTRPDESYFAR